MQAEEIMSIVAAHMGTTVQMMLSKNRRRENCDARCMFVHLMMQYGDVSLTVTRLGEMINKDHSTVVHMKKRHETMMGYDERYRRSFNALMATDMKNIVSTENTLLTIERHKAEILHLEAEIAKLKTLL